MVDFGGWELPVQFEGLSRNTIWSEKAGLFDVSHMCEIEIKGTNDEEFIQQLVTNNVKDLAEYQVLYSPMCYPHGGVVDDLLIYKYSRENYLLVVNASNTDKDFEWMQKNAPAGITVENVSANYAQLAIQGPMAQPILQQLTDLDLDTIKFFWFKPDVKIAGIECLVSRTGYTGEDGFEIYTAPINGFIWEEILQPTGKRCSLGLGAGIA